MISIDVATDATAVEHVSGKLPEYASELSSFHRAFAAELKEAIAGFPVQPQMRVLDVCCGDGFYLQLLSARVSCGGTLVGLDSNPPYLELARQRLLSLDLSCQVELICETIERLDPRSPGFDFVWCAQSLFSLRDPVAAMGAIAAHVLPGGTVAVLENDTLHQLQLPWPGHLEIVVRRAELAALEHESQHPEKYYVGRRLPEIFDAAGLDPCGFRTQAIDRTGPFDAALSKFLNAYLGRLSRRVAPHLETAAAKQFATLIDPLDESFLLNQPHVSLTWLNTLAWARRPE